MTRPHSYSFLARWIVVVAVGALWALSVEVSDAAGKKSDAVVKIAAKADKPDGDGKQIVTVTLTMEKGWHTYANPVGNEDLVGAQTVLTVAAKEKLVDLKIDYPAGTLVKDKTVGDYKVYEDKVEVKITLKRAKGDTSPLELTAKFQACDDKNCLLPATVKIPVE